MMAAIMLDFVHFRYPPETSLHGKDGHYNALKPTRVNNSKEPPKSERCYPHGEKLTPATIRSS